MKKRTLLITLGVLLSGITISSIGMSVSWYSQASDILSNDVEISLASDPTLLIGLKDENDTIQYSKHVYTKDLGEIKEFIPVSTMYDSTWLSKVTDETKDTTYPTFREAYTSPKYEDTSTYKMTKDATEGYFQRDIYLLSDKDCYASVSSDSTFSSDTTRNEEIAPTIKEFYPNLTTDEIIANLNTTYKSLRYSLYDGINYTILDPFKSTSGTTLAGPLDINKDGYFDYYSSNGTGYEFMYGEYTKNDKIIYSTNATTDETKLNTFVSKTKDGMLHCDLSASINNGLDAAKENSLSPTEIKAKNHLFALKRDVPYHMVLSIYLEGWDTDSISIAMYGAFTAYLKFIITEETIYG